MRSRKLGKLALAFALVATLGSMVAAPTASAHGHGGRHHSSTAKTTTVCRYYKYCNDCGSTVKKGYCSNCGADMHKSSSTCSHNSTGHKSGAYCYSHH